jgi:maleamate amidohydrolase
VKRPWTGIVPAEDERRYEAAGIVQSRGIGTRPALLVIDTQYRTVGLQARPFWESIAEFSTSCGDSGWEAVRQIARLLETFRANDLPIFFPHIAPTDVFEHASPAAPLAGDLSLAIEGYRFIEELAPERGEVLLPRKHPSAFFGTSLTGALIEERADSVVVVGSTTSDSVRASVVDAFSYQFKVTVPEDCTYDRSPVAHAVSLFDMAYLYADVRPMVDVISDIQAIGSTRSLDRAA